MRIFLIDDDGNLRDILAAFLEMKGHEVYVACDPTGCPAYDDISRLCPHEDPCGDILIVDQNMPNMTGLEFIRQQIERGCKGSVQHKAVISSGLTRQEEELAARLGCTVFLKPFSMLSLLEWLESVASVLPDNRKLVNFN